MTSDAELLETLESKLQIVRDRTRGVAEGYATGFFLWGEGGTSKSFTIEQVLREAGKPFKLTNSRVTAKGLVILLRDFPDVVHVIEDAESMFGDKNTAGLLRSALWGQAGPSGQQERTISWRTAKENTEFVFTGGIILVANCPLDDVPQLRAVKSRIASIHFTVTNDEVAAKMRQIASHGYVRGDSSLTPEKCLEVAHEIVARSAKLQRNLDLRLLVNGFLDRLQYEDGFSETDWRDLLDTRLKERVLARPLGVGIREKKKEEEIAVLCRIASMPRDERLAAWTATTGKSQASLYRRLNEMNLARF